MINIAHKQVHLLDHDPNNDVENFAPCKQGIRKAREKETGATTAETSEKVHPLLTRATT